MTQTKVPMQVQCHNCLAGNMPGSPYCSRCGAPLGDDAPQPIRPAANYAASDPVVQFCAEGQDRALVKQTYERATGILTQGETIEYIATARGGLTHAPDCVVATNKRVMLFRKKVLGKVDLDDCWWRDVGAVSLIESKSGVNLKLDAIQGWHMMVESLPKSQAARVYDLAFEYSDRLQATGQAANHNLSEARPVTAPAPTQPAAVVAPATPVLPRQPAPFASLATGPSSGGLAHMPAAPHSMSGAEAQPVQPLLTPATVPINYIPTPESVLQSILQSSEIEDGVPTRPIQWSAAFQAPPVADVQPVVLTGNSTDTDPQMRPLPPLTTLEKIAVFTPPSGPLALDGTVRPSTPLHSSPLGSGPLPAGSALDTPAWLETLAEPAGLEYDPSQTVANPATSLDWAINGSLGPAVVDAPTEGGPSVASDVAEVANSAPRPVLPTAPIVSAPLASLATSGPLNDALDSQSGEVMAESVQTEWSEGQHLLSPEQSTPEALRAIELNTMPPGEFKQAMDGDPMYDEGFSTVHPTAPMGSDDYLLPLPGSIVSGPLLAASGEMDPDMEELYRNTSSMATQKLVYEGPSDLGDLPTGINLSMHNAPPVQSQRSGRNSGGSGRDTASTGHMSADESKNSRSSGSRSSNSGRTKADDPIAKMKQLKTLLDAGLITEDDYAAKKADILARI